MYRLATVFWVSDCILSPQGLSDAPLLSFFVGACSMIEERERRNMSLETCFKVLFIAKSKRDLVL